MSLLDRNKESLEMLLLTLRLIWWDVMNTAIKKAELSIALTR